MKITQNVRFGKSLYPGVSPFPVARRDRQLLHVRGDISRRDVNTEEIYV